MLPKPLYIWYADLPVIYFVFFCHLAVTFLITSPVDSVRRVHNLLQVFLCDLVIADYNRHIIYACHWRSVTGDSLSLYIYIYIYNKYQSIYLSISLSLSLSLSISLSHSLSLYIRIILPIVIETRFVGHSFSWDKLIQHRMDWSLSPSIVKWLIYIDNHQWSISNKLC